MKVLAILGTLGSGKTTLINRVLNLDCIKMFKTLVVVNDVGKVNIDAWRIKSIGEVMPMTAGCIGCSDLPAFRKNITEAKERGDIDLLIIEPTGIADGGEIRQAVESCGLPCYCIVLFDVKHFMRNRALNTLPSQLAAADEVWLTWHYAHLQEDDSYEYIGRYAPGVSVGDIPNGEESFGKEMEKRLGRSHRDYIEHSGRSKPEGENISPKRRTSRHGDHGIVAYSFDLKPECGFADLVLAMAPYLQQLVRAKGAVAGREFDFTQGDLVLGKASNLKPAANFIATSPIPSEAFAGIAEPAAADTRTKKERMRSSDDIPLKDTLAAIEWQLEQYPEERNPKGFRMGTGELRVDCEADVAYQLAKRPGVPQEVWQKALLAYLKFRVRAAAEIDIYTNLAKNWCSTPKLSYWHRRLGTNLAWHAFKYKSDIPPELFSEILRYKPAQMAMLGLLGLKVLGYDDELAEERPELIEEVIQFGLQHEGLERDLIHRALGHCLSLSVENPAWHSRWQKVYNRYANN